MSCYYLSDELVFTHAFYALKGIRDYLTVDEINLVFRGMLQEDVFAEIDADPTCAQPKRVMWQLEVLRGDSRKDSLFVVTDGFIYTFGEIDDERLYIENLVLSFDDPLRRSLPKTRERFREYVENADREKESLHIKEQEQKTCWM